MIHKPRFGRDWDPDALVRQAIERWHDSRAQERADERQKARREKNPFVLAAARRRNTTNDNQEDLTNGV